MGSPPWLFSKSTRRTFYCIRVSRLDHPLTQIKVAHLKMSFFPFQIDTGEGLDLRVTAEGRGLALFQVG